MLRNRIGTIIVVVVLAAIGFALFQALRPAPVPAETSTIGGGPMTVYVEEEGIARYRDVYTVSAPVAGSLARVTLEVGDRVEAGKTTVASIHPLEPPFLDDRTRSELQSQADAARSGVALAEAEQHKAETALEQALSDMRRATTLAQKDFVSQSRVEQAQSLVQLRESEKSAAEASVALRRAELEAVEARLRQPETDFGNGNGDECCVRVMAPVDGVVLQVMARSETAVTTGSQIVEIGDPAAVEISVDVLSSDAVSLKPGMQVEIVEWGGEKTLPAVVERIDPAARTKVSALGISEQRVSVVIRLDDVPPGLGHGYRVVARLAIWSADDTVQVPVAALFRSDGAWAVFVIEEGTARLRKIETGRMNDDKAQVVTGLKPGEIVVVYPSDRIAHGTLLEVRDSPAQK